MINDYRLIKRFFNFELTKRELDLVEHRLEEDSEFREKMRFYEFADTKFKTEFEAQEITEKQQLKQEWAKWNNTTPTPSLYRRLQSPKILGVAASLILLFGICIWWLNTTPQLDKNQLVAQYWNETAQVTQIITRASTNDDQAIKDLTNALNLYNKSQYGQALVQLEKLTTTALFDQVILLQGQCYFQLNEVDSAAQKFQQVIDLEQVGLKDKARWYLALTYLKGDNYGLAKQQLNIIIERDYPLAKDAKELLQKL